MSNIHIIAGPPGVGKSTRGSEFIPPELEILNEDEIRHRYKAKGYTDYNEYSLQKVRGLVLRNLIDDKDFALELNLGYEHHYKYVLPLKSFCDENKLNVILFFTDHLDLCQKRADERHKNGLHLVKPNVIETMYYNTIPLLKQNFQAFDRLIMLDAKKTDEMVLQGIYSKATEQLKIIDKSARWFSQDVLPFVEEQLRIKRFDNPSLKNWESKDFNQDR